MQIHEAFRSCLTILTEEESECNHCTPRNRFEITESEEGLSAWRSGVSPVEGSQIYIKRPLRTLCWSKSDCCLTPLPIQHIHCRPDVAADPTKLLRRCCSEDFTIWRPTERRSEAAAEVDQNQTSSALPTPNSTPLRRWKILCLNPKNSHYICKETSVVVESENHLEISESR